MFIVKRVIGIDECFSNKDKGESRILVMRKLIRLPVRVPGTIGLEIDPVDAPSSVLVFVCRKISPCDQAVDGQVTNGKEIRRLLDR